MEDKFKTIRPDDLIFDRIWTGTRRVIIIDIDGTIAKVGDRLKYLKQSPKDWDKFYEECFDDEPILEIIEALHCLSGMYDFIFCTGRIESVRDQTEKWLKKHNLKGTLLMRPNNDYRHDTEVKPLLIEKCGVNKIQVRFILEDSNVMVSKWRELGYKCLHVEDGDF